jgi:hypothetical protein
MKGKEKRAESASLLARREEREMPDQVLELGMSPLKWKEKTFLCLGKKIGMRKAFI